MLGLLRLRSSFVHVRVAPSCMFGLLQVCSECLLRCFCFFECDDIIVMTHSTVVISILFVIIVDVAATNAVDVAGYTHHQCYRSRTLSLSLPLPESRDSEFVSNMVGFMIALS